MLTVRIWIRAKCSLALTLLALSGICSADSEKVLYSFTGGQDGGNPASGLIADKAGNLYGTTYSGGSNCSPSGCGTVFELSPVAGGGWSETVLHGFQGAPDGSLPGSRLIFDSAGNLYGTTISGGMGSCTSGIYPGCGTVFELSPNTDGTWAETVLYSFNGHSDGGGPSSGLVFDSAGNLFGTADGGGQGGAIFELSPGSGGRWTQTVLYRFSGDSYSSSDLIFDSEGNLYGTAVGCCGVFELSPMSAEWRFATLYRFMGGGNGSYPETAVTFDSNGSLYGTLSSGGNSRGVLFELKHTGQQWQESMMYNFCSRNNCVDGSIPSGPLSYNAGHFYGTTYVGGESGCGTVFEVDPPHLGWKETVLYSFRKGNADGCRPNGPVIFGPDGNIYGTTSAGGDGGAGTVFEIVLSTPTPGQTP